MRPGRIQDVFSGVLAVCAVVAVATMLSDRRGIAAGSTRPDARPIEVEGWADMVSVGHRVGAASPDLVILEFGDYECPACAGFETGTLRPFLEENRDRVALVYRHWPLPYHRFALPAARAAECAASQGRFESFHRQLFDTQDSLGLVPFTALAQRAGVPDSVRFAACVEREEPFPAIERDVAAVTTLGGTGTPTIVVNGYLWHRLPSRGQLDSILSLARTGKEDRQ